MRHLVPSEATALIVRVALPHRLEALRMRSVPDAVDGLPAHVTLAYPFAEPAAIDEALLALVAESPAIAPILSPAGDGLLTLVRLDGDAPGTPNPPRR